MLSCSNESDAWIADELSVCPTHFTEAEIDFELKHLLVNEWWSKSLR